MDKPSSAGLRDEMRAIVRAAAEPRPVGDSAKAAFRRAADVLDISFRRVRSLWYAYADLRVSPDEAAYLRAAHERSLNARLERLRDEITKTEQLIWEARRHHAATVEIVARANSGMAPVGGTPAGDVAEASA